jgi:hypothetical protein
VGGLGVDELAELLVPLRLEQLQLLQQVLVLKQHCALQFLDLAV